MNRRQFVRSAGLAPVCAGLQRYSGLRAEEPAAWRTFEVRTNIEVLKPSGITRVWAPMPLIARAPFQKTLASTFHCEGGKSKTFERKADGLELLAVEFPDGVKPAVTMTSRITTRDWAVDLSEPSSKKQSTSADLKYFLRPTQLLPTDGIVKSTADQITKNSGSDVDKARAIYEWIVENTSRNPKTRGCGRGDIRYMLESRDLSGKCADLNALFVGLSRAAGLPARDVYGIRTVKSELGYKSLGASSEQITKAQHCRAEVHLSNYGWVAVDPADVRKVMLEEPPGNRSLADNMVKKARERLFGSWEMNWMAYNYAHDVVLPGSSGPAVPFLMYPQAETADGRLDCLDADSFKYEITSREIAANG